MLPPRPPEPDVARGRPKELPDERIVAPPLHELGETDEREPEPPPKLRKIDVPPLLPLEVTSCSMLAKLGRAGPLGRP